MKVMLTGASGFVGQAAAEAFSNVGIEVVRTTRITTNNTVGIGNVDCKTDWRRALNGCAAVVHLAARAHVIRDDAIDPLAVYRSVNTEGTLNLATQAAAAGVRRFIFVSSVKVNGESTTPGTAFKEIDVPCPEDPYGISKHAAEVGLRKIANETGLEVVFIRPPLVYGPGVKGNFSTLMRWLKRGIPLPLASVTDNRRSLVALDNLVDLLLTCIEHPAAANEIFLVSDGIDLSTAELLQRLGLAMGKPVRLLPVSPSSLQAAANLLGKSDMARRLLGNLQLDISHTCQKLGWKPPISVDEGLRRAAQGFIK